MPSRFQYRAAYLNPRYEEFNGFLEAKGSRWYPHVNVFETDKCFELRAELPGFGEKDVEVLLRGDIITIKGNKAEENGSGYHYYIGECPYGFFTRTITLPFEPDRSSMKVSFEKGILSITWPLSAGIKGNTIKLPVHH